MMTRPTAGTLFTVYQLLASFVVLPISFMLWSAHFGGRRDLALVVVAIPVLFGYIIPGIGTNLLGLWEFKAGLHFGRYTLFHGLMFGGASSFLAYTCSPIMSGSGFRHMLASAHVMAAVIGFWNWVFDGYAIRTGLAVIYNKPHFEGRSAAEIVGDYAPVYFGAFGACFGTGIHLLGNWDTDGSTGLIWPAAGVCAFLSMGLPVVAHCIWSLLRHGYSGLRPYSDGSGRPGGASAITGTLRKEDA
ncbi:MAG: hypothetical protein JW863_20815 [Chitinispirillaceae bacterium]|nr:hypothetical protein [Chitinispirillaceae bacterium]